MSIYSVILAGGKGSRLWPLSREELPKQFHSLPGHRTLLQQTVLRAARVSEAGKIIIVTGGHDGALAFHQARQVVPVTRDALLEEPVGRGTAPAIALALLRLLEGGCGRDDVVLVTPSDHIIRDEEAFLAAVFRGEEAARQGRLVVFGVRPDRPETGFGYILAPGSSESASPVERFVEKPDGRTAGEYLRDGRYFWNSGMFLFTAGTMLDELALCAPDIGLAARRGYGALMEAFPSLPCLSVDHAVMEKTARASMVPLDAGWSDVGSWDALYETEEKDKCGNVISGDVVALNVRNSLLFSPDRLVVGIDLQDTLVVDGGDALLVAPRGSSQKVRDAVTLLKEQGRREAVEPVETVRPWGRYRLLHSGNRFRIKHLTVDPGKRLSLQYHLHRSEHWVVVRGQATVRSGDVETILSEGESTFIPKGVPHRLENRGKIPLEVIETQTGNRLSEDDIIRLDDDYGR